LANNNNRTITFLIVSNRKGVTKRFVLPVVWLKAGGLVLALVGIFASVAAVDYVGLLLESVQLKRYKAENARLETQFQLVEGKMAALEKQMDKVKNSWIKLRMITNMEDPDRAMKLAMGPVTAPGRSIDELNVPIEQREPAGITTKEDSSFLEAPPLDLSKGEIAVQSKDYSSLSIRIDEAVKESSLREQGIIELWESLQGRQNLMKATPSSSPVRGWFTSRFGYRISPMTGRAMMHQGLDIAAAPGTSVYSPADGVVSFAGYDSGYGKLVSVDHGYGVVTRYGHNSKIFVKLGQTVRRGDLLTAVGNTGHSTGPHLHYEVRINGVPVDPTNYILEE
jgi:murein DD-endopeptidase MepM/ murein hydrolase activator NlpD